MKIFNIYIFIFFSLKIIFSKTNLKEALKENKFVNNKKFMNFLEKEEEKTNINDLLNSIKKIEEEIKNDINNIKEKANKLNNENLELNLSLYNNISSAYNYYIDNKNYSKRTRYFIYFMIIIALVIYIIELKYINKDKEISIYKEKIKNIQMHNIPQNQSTKLNLT